ncbi:MAG: response regulator [Dechloromonas sp.]|uniref:Response regulator n=1 Tax=Candidatus Dechloromonas phosphorivorans TaxID=2899244 RepID=A0A935JYS0_9RHOO|nr:response regulator [Candidatus Dechloromonas phosphorivorans]
MVDDNSLARNVLGRLLEKAGCQTVLVESGEQALGMLVENKDTPFDFVTIDYNMPGMDGIELAECIRRLPLNPVPRLVMVTSSDTHELEEAGRMGNIETVLHKPITAEQINRLVTSSNGESANNAGSNTNLLADTAFCWSKTFPPTS